uniref:Putative secreted protein n=1 Tax=Anopheles darlingi TaxID=43151 RepID=A0A2M4DG99_ANODA
MLEVLLVAVLGMVGELVVVVVLVAAAAEQESALEEIAVQHRSVGHKHPPKLPPQSARSGICESMNRIYPIWVRTRTR